MGRAAAVLVLMASACGSASAPPAFDPNPPGWQSALDGALTYLETTEAEFGLDVVVALQIVGALSGDPRPTAIAAARREGLGGTDLARYGILLDAPKPLLPAASLRGVMPSPTTPDPAMVLPPDGLSIGACLGEVLACRPDAECTNYLSLEHQWGYVLTHQAVWLLFSHWGGCAPPVDFEQRRRILAANLVKEMKADPTFTDLAAERLAMLGHMGFGSAIEPGWIATVLAAQEPEGCWRVNPDRPCHPHATGVALWALALARTAGRFPRPSQ